MIELINRQVALRPIRNPMKRGSLYIPDMAVERVVQGIVKYIGPKVKDVKPGDYCLFPGYSGTLIDLQDEGSLIIMPEQFLSAIVHPPNTEISGLFFQDREGLYFQATYEMAIELIAQGIEDAPWYNAVKEGKRLYEVSSKNDIPVLISDTEGE